MFGRGFVNTMMSHSNLFFREYEGKLEGIADQIEKIAPSTFG